MRFPGWCSVFPDRCRGEWVIHELEGDLAQLAIKGAGGVAAQRLGERFDPGTQVLVEQGPAQGAGMMSGARALSARRNPR